MIISRLITTEGVTENINVSDWPSMLANKAGFLWIDIRKASPEELRTIGDQFGFHDVCIESCMHPYSRPTLHQFADHICLNMTLIQETDNEIIPEELHVFAGEGYLVTVIEEEQSETLNVLLKDYMDDLSLAERGSLYATYLVAEALVDSYVPFVEDLDDNVDKLEDKMLESADKSMLQQLFQLKGRLFDLRRLLAPQRDIFTGLARRRLPFTHEALEVYFNDLYSRMVYLFDVMDMNREVLSNSLDIYLSATSNRLNEILKVLTVAATVLMTLGFITGFFGMNFVSLPWLSSPNAFRNTVVAMIGITVSMLYMFKRKGWL